MRKLVCLVALCVTVAACQHDTSFEGLPSGANLAVPDAPKPTEISQSYRLSPQDIIQVEVFDVPSLGRTVQLDAAGTVNLPFIGAVPAAGMTAIQLAGDLQSRYGEKYLKNPQISVLVRQAKVETITVDGAVGAPGVFPATANLSLIRAIALARGVDQLGNPHQVVVFRTVNDQRVAGLFDLSDIRAGKAPDPPIYANDTIVVAVSNSRRALRDIVGVVPLVAMLPLIVP